MAKKRKRGMTMAARQAAERAAAQESQQSSHQASSSAHADSVQRSEAAKPETEPSRAVSGSEVPAANQPKSFRGPHLCITLNSDLLAGSGDGFSSGIDQDVCFDSKGLPFIPARRLKGCLREAAVEIGIDEPTISFLFGETGSSKPGALRIMNATLMGGVVLHDPQATLSQYAYSRVQTKMDRETHSVMDETLRIVRVVKQWMPNGSKTQFVAPVEFECDIEDATAIDAWNKLRKTARALRNIGMGRNRGFGAVRCELMPEALENGTTANDAPALYKRIDKGDTAFISYHVRLDSTVMLPQQNGTRSAAFIPGTSVHGFFAGQMARLVSRGVLTQNDFDQLFFGTQTSFSPLYPVDENKKRCLPAAPFVVKVKGGKRNGDYLRADAFEPDVGESAKSLKDGFMSPGTWRSVEVGREIVFHHSTGSDSTLYTQECLSAGQEFAGFIRCPKEQASLIEGVLRKGTLSFGRSKTAQYSRCSVVNCDEDLSGFEETIDIVRGRSYALLLESDVLLLESDGAYTTTFSALADELKAKLGECFGASDVSSGAKHPISSIAVRTIGGYNAKWNQKKPHVQAYAAGSCVVFAANENAKDVPCVFTIGERLQEGYGRVRIIDLHDVQPISPKKSVVTSADSVETDQVERARLAIVNLADDDCNRWFTGNGAFTSSFVGRLTLMVTEATDATDLDARIASIKVDEEERDNRRDRARGLVAAVRACLGENAQWAVEKECLLLLLAMGKYFQKQANAGKKGVER